MSLALPFLRGSFSLKGGSLRDAMPNLEGLLPRVDLKLRSTIEPEPDEDTGDELDNKQILAMMNRAVKALEAMQERCTTLEQQAEEATKAHAAALAKAEKDVGFWKKHADDQESQVKAQESRLAEAETTVIELRSRLICLYSKLAASTETMRFNSLAKALVEQIPGSDQGLNPPTRELLERLHEEPLQEEPLQEG